MESVAVAGSAGLGEAGPRIVVFTGDPSYTVRRSVFELLEGLPRARCLVLWHTPEKSFGQLLRSQRMNIRRNGWRWIPYQMAEVWRRLLVRPPGELPADVPGASLRMQSWRLHPQVQIQRVKDIHGEATLTAVREFNPHLGLSLAAPILKDKLFRIPTLGTLNLHKGQVPQFRGMPPGFWERWTGASTVGCTVHWMDVGLDTGEIEAEASLPIPRYATVRGLQLQLDEIGNELLVTAAKRVLAGQCLRRSQTTEGAQTFRKPTLAQLSAMRRRERTIDPHTQSALRRSVKDAVLGAAFAMAMPTVRLRAPQVTVLLYHRVSDDVRDNLTVGIAQFERQMALLRQHCEILSIEDVIALGSRIPRGRRPVVAVTFDDGYLDNHTHAAPILRRHGVPAAFFVSTGIVASENPFPHDLRRGNGWIPVMNWDHLRQMREWGFTIGSHTVSHIDCARADPVAVQQELMQSRLDLERELGVANLLFAYPYGGRDNMTAQALGWVREAGYAGCLSAYGGSNVGKVDRYNVLRRGVHWEFSDTAFMMRALGLV